MIFLVKVKKCTLLFGLGFPSFYLRRSYVPRVGHGTGESTSDSCGCCGGPGGQENLTQKHLIGTLLYSTFFYKLSPLPLFSLYSPIVSYVWLFLHFSSFYIFPDKTANVNLS